MKTVDISFGYNIPTNIQLDKEVGFDYAAVKRFGLFLADMQGADCVQLRYKDYDGTESISCIDVDDVNDVVDDMVVDYRTQLDMTDHRLVQNYEEE